MTIKNNIALLDKQIKIQYIPIIKTEDKTD